MLCFSIWESTASISLRRFPVHDLTIGFPYRCRHSLRSAVLQSGQDQMDVDEVLNWWWSSAGTSIRIGQTPRL
jgi:hypothetical protein